MSSRPALPFNISPMTVADIPAAIAIEKAAYNAPPHRNYADELERNPLAHYFVLRLTAISYIDAPPAAIGIGGLWLIADELHIMTIAIEARWQRLGLGEWLLLTLVEHGQTLNASVVTLEVRPSNGAALSLYKKYNFQEVGRRSAYYSDNGEDALILTTPPLLLPDYQAMLTRRKQELWPRLAQIRVDKINQIR